MRCFNLIEYELNTLLSLGSRKSRPKFASGILFP
jgi:hypothetical protein